VAFSKGPNRVGVSFPSPEARNRASFRNVVFSSYLEFQTVDKVHKPSESTFYKPSSEPFRFCMETIVVNMWKRRFINVYHDKYVSTSL
jgi:hypothetical protein